jgi:hypothetical protein
MLLGHWQEMKAIGQARGALDRETATEHGHNPTEGN